MNTPMTLDKTALRKALETSGDGAALLPYDLETYLGEELLKTQPLTELIPVMQAEGKTHEYNLRTSHPLGWFEGEQTAANFANSTYARKSTMLKIQRIWGSVTGFARTMDAAFIDALAAELEGSLEGMSNIFEFGLIYACSDELVFKGDPFQYSGIFPRLAALAPTNVIDCGSAKVTLAMLDKGLAKIGAFRQSRNDPKMWVMGLQMKQIVDGLQTKIQIPLTQTELNDGQITMANYGKAPILESDYVVPADATTSPADLTPTVDVVGTLAAKHHYRIASVTVYGEQIAAAASIEADCSATGKKVVLAWTADAEAKLYMIFRNTGAGAYGLLDIVPALTYDATGKVNGAVIAYTDTGAKTPIAIKPLEVGEEQIILLNRNPERGVAFLGKVDDMGRQTGKLMSYVELARTRDAYDYMIKAYLGLRIKYPNVACCILRNVKRA